MIVNIILCPKYVIMYFFNSFHIFFNDSVSPNSKPTCLISSNHGKVLGGQNIIDAIFAVKSILQLSTSSFGFFLRDAGLCKTAPTLSPRIFWHDASLWELRSRCLVEQHVLVGENLPLIAVHPEVVNDGGSITSKSLTSAEVSKQTDSLSKCLFARWRPSNGVAPSSHLALTALVLTS